MPQKGKHGGKQRHDHSPPAGYGRLVDIIFSETAEPDESRENVHDDIGIAVSQIGDPEEIERQLQKIAVFGGKFCL